jgi:putative ABC transport system permease protein
MAGLENGEAASGHRAEGRHVMTRHVFKLVWNRKRSTGLILVEILVCFLVLCGVSSAIVSTVMRWRQPLGFNYENVWSADIGGTKWDAEGDEAAAENQTLSDLLRTVKGLDEVESAAYSCNTPYSGSSWINSTWIDGRSERVYWTVALPEMFEVLELEMVYGRWIEETDSALDYQPLVISLNLARDLFGTENAVGQDLPEFDDEGKPKTPEEDAEINRIVGVVADCRRGGEFQDMPYVAYSSAGFTADHALPTELLIRVRPGTTGAFEEKLVRAMQSVTSRWTYTTTTLESRRGGVIQSYLGPIILSVVVAGFLILMVGLGLVGVLWLSVTRRTAEMGLRRALGATGGSVRRQVLGELWALTTMAIVVGAAIFLQLPLFGGNFGVGWSVFISGLLLAVLITFGFVTVCGLYPTWLVTRIHPASALQCE